MSQNTVRRLRPYLFTAFERVQCQSTRRVFSCSGVSYKEKLDKDHTHDYDKRVAQLEKTRGSLAECYHRMPSYVEQHLDYIQFIRKKHKDLKRGETDKKTTVTVAGKHEWNAW